MASVDLPLPGAASDWVKRWSHLVKPQGRVLDVACGPGRHMNWFAQRGHPTTGVDRSPEAARSAARFGQFVLADIENDAWPLMDGLSVRPFDAVVVTHYLWRPLLPVIEQSVAPGGVLLYETFAQGNETVGKPSRPDFLLRPGELLHQFANMQIIAFEEGFLDHPSRFVQRIAAVQPLTACLSGALPVRYTL